MIRVYAIVEGQTEEAFVGKVLAPEFWGRDIHITAIVVGRPGYRGGSVNYDRVSRDVLKLLKQERKTYCTTMIDFYGLGRGFPGTPPPAQLSNLAKVRHIEAALKQDICARIPDFRPDLRFIPYLQLHEYEALLFSDPKSFATGINQAHLAQKFQQIRDAFPTPEDINDTSTTAPSKRVMTAYPAYSKVIEGTQAAMAVGIAAMRAACHHFREWLETLESIVEL